MHPQSPGPSVSVASPSSPRGAVFGGGVVGNERLTAAVGIALLVLLFLEGLTLRALRVLVVPHVFAGAPLIPPLVLKLGSTGYRFVRYYTADPGYRAAGPPSPVLRIVAPLLVLSIVILIVSGSVLLVTGPGDNLWRRIHLVAFLGWFWIMTIHVVVYAPRALREAWRDRASRGQDVLAGATMRHAAVAAVLLLGVILATASLPLAGNWAHGMDLPRGFDH